jgi:hypothetical protein
MMEAFLLFLSIRRQGQSPPIQGVQALRIDDVEQQQLCLKQPREREGNPEGLLRAGREIHRHQNFIEQTICHGTSAYNPFPLIQQS